MLALEVAAEAMLGVGSQVVLGRWSTFCRNFPLSGIIRVPPDEFGRQLQK
jgi:hypothetical protein